MIFRHGRKHSPLLVWHSRLQRFSSAHSGVRDDPAPSSFSRSWRGEMMKHLATKELFEEFGLVNYKYVEYINNVHWLYVMESPPYVKVGISNDVERRLRDFSLNSPHHIRIIFKAKVPYPQAKWIEEKIHEDLQAFRHKGEWFTCTADEAVASFRVASKLGRARQQRFVSYANQRGWLRR